MIVFIIYFIYIQFLNYTLDKFLFLVKPNPQNIFCENDHDMEEV